MQGLHALILAAGKGTRMKSDLPKVVHTALGKPMVSYVIDAVKTVGSEKTVLVVGYKSDVVKAALKGADVSYVEQAPEQLGTGHAVQCYAKTVKERPAALLTVCGDTPLISVETLNKMVKLHEEEKPAVTMMTLVMQEPGSYGRVLRNTDGTIKAIREAKDCTEEELKVKEVNMAVYLFDSNFLMDNIFKLSNNNKQGEYYLTDLIEMAYNQGLKVLGVVEADEESTLGVNTPEHLAKVEEILKRKGFN